MQKRMKTGSYVAYQNGVAVSELYALKQVTLARSLGFRVVTILTHLREFNRAIREAR